MSAAPGKRVPATVLAAQMIGRALDNSVRPDVLQIAEATALTVREVTALVDQVRADRNRRTRGKTSGPAAVPSPRTPAAGLDLIEANLKHKDLAVRRAAARAHTARIAAAKAVNELRDALARAQTYAERDARIAELRNQIAQIQGRQPCPECGALIQPNRMTYHHTRKHN